jgi:alpha-1,2-mannosyltransferase
MTLDPHPRWSLPRRFVAGIAAALAAVVWSHGLAAVLRHLGPDTAPRAGLALTLCALVAAAAGAAALPRRGALAAAVAGALAAAVAVALSPAAVAEAPWAALAAVPFAAALAVGGAGWLGRQLPASVDTVLARRRVLAVAWAFVAVVAVAQTGRLAAWISDPAQELVVGTRNPFWFGHECLPAYLYGAELTLAGESPYDHHHYPALDAGAAPASRLEMRVDDPYQYPPQFLLLPAAALAASDDYLSIRAAWMALQITLFAGVFAALALWVGGAGGRFALWALPAVLVAFPMSYTFQYGQFHLAAVALAVAAMLAFSGGRRRLGGLLLAVAILAKLFPAVLLAALLGQRRWRDLAWTAGWGVAITALALAVLGPAPFVAFATDHLPALSDGSAFAFDEAWPELAELVVVDNQGVFGLARKLGAGKPLAAQVSRLFALALLAAAGWAGWRFRDAGRWGRGALWLALLGAASLASPGAWGDYVPATAVWLLALVAARAQGRPWLAAGLTVAAVFQVFLLGTMPIGDWGPTAVLWPVSTVGAALLLGLFAAVIASRPEGWRRPTARVGDREAEPTVARAAA